VVAVDPINDILIDGDLLVSATVDGIESFSLASGEVLVYLEGLDNLKFETHF
jgi:hypothetical protein